MKKYDQKHWVDRSPPFCPNEYEIELYKHHVKGFSPVCLLGMTKELQFLCNFMVDDDPSLQDKPVINIDWNKYQENSEVIIGDGVLNLEGIQLVDKLMKYCKKLVCRVFLKKFDWMKYAKHFPNEFPNSKLVIPTQKDIVMVIWEK